MNRQGPASVTRIKNMQFDSSQSANGYVSSWGRLLHPRRREAAPPSLPPSYGASMHHWWCSEVTSPVLLFVLRVHHFRIIAVRVTFQRLTIRFELSEMLEVRFNANGQVMA